MPFFRGLQKNGKERKRMKVVTGAYSKAKIFTDNVEEYAIAQVQMICDNEVSKDARICLMPDVHPGKVGPVGGIAEDFAAGGGGAVPGGESEIEVAHG